MKLQIVKYKNDEGITRWKITKDGSYISMYLTENEAIERFDKIVERLKQPIEEEEIVKTFEI